MSNHSNLLQLGTYELYESGHPGYVENVNMIIKTLKDMRIASMSKGGEGPFTVLEVGAGPGTLLTKCLGEEFSAKGARVIVNEIDVAAFKVLWERAHVGFPHQRVLHGGIEIPEPESALDWMEKAVAKGEKLDAIVSNFTMHHIRPDQLDQFFELANQLLKPGGKVISGEEYLDFMLEPQALELLGLSAVEARNVIAVGLAADELLLDSSNVEAQKTYDQARTLFAKDIEKLGIPADASAMEFRQYVRPAAMVAYHVGRIIYPALDEGKIKLPCLEFNAMASGLATMQEFFVATYGEEAAQLERPADNRLAINMLDRYIEKVANRIEGSFPEWEEIEKFASQKGRINAQEARESVLKAIEILRESLSKHSNIGLSNPAEIYDPELRYELPSSALVMRNKEVLKGGEMIEVPGIDYKITPMYFAQVAARHGLDMSLVAQGVSVNHEPNTVISMQNEVDGEVYATRIFGAVGVSVVERANEKAQDKSAEISR